MGNKSSDGMDVHSSDFSFKLIIKIHHGQILKGTDKMSVPAVACYKKMAYEKFEKHFKFVFLAWAKVSDPEVSNYTSPIKKQNKNFDTAWIA